MDINEHRTEQQLIEKLRSLKYAYRRDIRNLDALERNFREKFEALNRVKLTDSEFERLLEQIVTPDIFANAEHLRALNHFEREDGTPLYYQLVNLKDWCKNHFEVVNQLRINTKSSHHRYDVILLVNGLPLVQIELKSLQVSPRKAMQQIINYRNDPGNGYTNSLLCFMQLFIVSNRSQTWYFANNNEHFAFNVEERFLPIYRWAAPDNKKITHLDEFAEAFLAKCRLAEMLSRYMVLIQNERKLMMMRPYQIYAVKAIIDCIQENRGNGYIWHTTGSGKTLTSFKASTLLKDNPDIEKCLFVVDRKDLDRQTRDEFNRFQPGCVEENTNTEALVQRLLSDDYKDKVIVTTIQKLGLALDGNHNRQYRERLESLRNKRVVFIFDECHRSQFGENHKAIREFFPRAQLFGFTGTPIFEQNATYQRVEGEQASMVTTQDIFEKRLHAYTITHAIDDGNVLRFHVDYYKPDGASIKPGETLAKRAVAEAILGKHDAATNERKFNAILATASIDDAIEYFHLFKEIQAEQAADEDYIPLNIACVFSPPAEGSRDVAQLQEDLPQELEDNKVEPNRKKAALKEIIDDYNTRYGTGHNLSNFDSYYQDVQQRIKDQKYPNSDLPHDKKIDITIVVDMLLTGFDSQYLNTLYVDKNLKYHSLIQAFSRTNRVLNDSKPYGNILDFRAQQAAVDEAIALFSGEAPDRAKEVWLVDPAPKVIEKLEEAAQKLKEFMATQGLEARPEEVANLKGDEARAGFIERFKEVRRLITRLDQYTDLGEEEKAKIEALIPHDDLRAFSAQYLETAKQLQEESKKREDNPNDPIQQLDFEFVLFDSALIDYDYIMKLITRFSSQPPKKQKMTREQLMGLLASSARLMDEREDLEAYIATLKEGEGLDEAEIRRGYEQFKAQRQAEELAHIAEKHDLPAEALQDFVDHILDRYIFDPDALTELFRPKELGWKARARAELALMEDLIPLLRKKAEGREISGLEVYEE